MEARKFTDGRDLWIVYLIPNSLQTMHKLKETTESQLQKYRDQVVKRCVEKAKSLRKSDPRLVIVYVLCFATLL